MENQLTKEEKAFLRKFCRGDGKSDYAYMVACFLSLVAIVGVVLGLYFQSKDGFLIAIYFGTLATTLSLKTQNDKKLIRIIKKLRVIEAEPQ